MTRINMHLRVMSDLHLDFTYVEPATLGLRADEILILAGDLGEQKTAVDFVKDCASRCKQVIYVMGNHEYYKGTWEATCGEIDEAVDRTNALVTECDSVEIDDVVFICATLWTDFKRHDPESLKLAMNYMPDYSQIWEENGESGKSFLKPTTVYNRHVRDRDFIDATLKKNKGKKCVVVTHHAPSALSLHKRFQGFGGNEFFYSDLDWLMAKHSNLGFWVHGHMHNNSYYNVNNTTVLCNPRGYTSRYNEQKENPDWNPKLTVEL